MMIDNDLCPILEYRTRVNLTKVEWHQSPLHIDSSEVCAAFRLISRSQAFPECSIFLGPILTDENPRPESPSTEVGVAEDGWCVLTAQCPYSLAIHGYGTD